MFASLLPRRFTLPLTVCTVPSTTSLVTFCSSSIGSTSYNTSKPPRRSNPKLMSFVIPVAVNTIVIKNAITIVKKATIRPLFFMYMFLPLTALSLSCPLIHCHLPEQQLKPLDHLLDKRATLIHSYTYSG